MAKRSRDSSILRLSGYRKNPMQSGTTSPVELIGLRHRITTLDLLRFGVLSEHSSPLYDHARSHPSDYEIKRLGIWRFRSSGNDEPTDHNTVFIFSRKPLDSRYESQDFTFPPSTRSGNIRIYAPELRIAPPDQQFGITMLVGNYQHQPVTPAICYSPGSPDPGGKPVAPEVYRNLLNPDSSSTCAIHAAHLFRSSEPFSTVFLFRFGRSQLVEVYTHSLITAGKKPEANLTSRLVFRRKYTARKDLNLDQDKKKQKLLHFILHAEDKLNCVNCSRMHHGTLSSEHQKTDSWLICEGFKDPNQKGGFVS